MDMALKATVTRDTRDTGGERLGILRGLDGDAALLLVLAGVGEPGLAGLGAGYDSGLRDQRVGQRRLAVVDVGDDGHVADVPLLVHHAPDLVYSEVHLRHTSYNVPYVTRQRSKVRYVWS